MGGTEGLNICSTLCLVGGIDDDFIRLGDSSSEEKMVHMRPSVEVGISGGGSEHSPRILEYLYPSRKMPT